MSSNTVTINDQALASEISTSLKNQANIIDEKFNQASNLFLYGDPTEWAGKDADAYKQKLEELKAKVTTSIEDVRNMSQKVEKESQEITEHADTKASEAESLAG